MAFSFFNQPGGGQNLMPFMFQMRQQRLNQRAADDEQKGREAEQARYEQAYTTAKDAYDQSMNTWRASRDAYQAQAKPYNHWSTFLNYIAKPLDYRFVTGDEFGQFRQRGLHSYFVDTHTGRRVYNADNQQYDWWNQGNPPPIPTLTDPGTAPTFDFQYTANPVQDSPLRANSAKMGAMMEMAGRLQQNPTGRQQQGKDQEDQGSRLSRYVNWY